jgi:uncharacterized membrane protein YdbT with pleckstrin-like domain
VAGNEGLAPGEQLVLRLHPHAKTLVRPGGLLLLIIIVAVVVMFLLPSNAVSLGLIRLLIGVVALAAVFAWVGIPLLKWRATSYELTNRRLRLRDGILTRNGRDFPLNRISDVSFQQGLIDRIFGCGKLIVESPGEQGQLILPDVPEVQQVQGVLFQLVGEETARIGSPPYPYQY